MFSADGVLPGNTFTINREIFVGNLADIEIFDADGGFNGGDDLIERREFSNLTLPSNPTFGNGNSKYSLGLEIF